MTAPLTHEQRLEVINRPFFITRIDRSYPWAGTITVSPSDRSVEDLIEQELEASIRREMLLYLLQTEVDRFNLFRHEQNNPKTEALITLGWYGENRATIRKNIEEAYDAGWDARTTAEYFAYPDSLVSSVRGTLAMQRRAERRRRLKQTGAQEAA